MDSSQIFKQWYAHLYPDDQDILRQYLVAWFNSQLGIGFVSLNQALPNTVPPVVAIFFNWYFYSLTNPNLVFAQQLSLDQQTLCNYLRSWLNPPHPSQRIIEHPGMIAGGTPTASIRGRHEHNHKQKCPSCGFEF